MTTVPELAHQPLLLMDVGGGSTEFILGQGENRHFCQSFRLGVLRLYEKMPPGDPPSARQLPNAANGSRVFSWAKFARRWNRR